MVVSSDLNPKFLNFWPVVASSWKNFFDLSPTLAIVYRSRQKAIFTQIHGELAKYGDVVPIETELDFPIQNLAKLARYFVASTYGSDIVMIDDIDTLHLPGSHLIVGVKSKMTDLLTAVGSEVYFGTIHEGNFPAGNFGGSASAIGELFDFLDRDFDRCVAKFNRPAFRSVRENPANRPADFSDEYLLSSQIALGGFRDQIRHLRRDQDISTEWVDRSWWPEPSEIQKSRHRYQLVNFLRPYFENEQRINETLRILEIPVFPLLIPVSVDQWVRENHIRISDDERQLREIMKMRLSCAR